MDLHVLGIRESPTFPIVVKFTTRSRRERMVDYLTFCTCRLGVIGYSTARFKLGIDLRHALEACGFSSKGSRGVPEAAT